MGRKGSEVSPSERYPLRSAHTSGRVLRSASANDNKDGELLNASATQADVKKRSGSQLDSPNISARVLRSTSRNKDEACSKSLNERTPGKPAANKRKNAGPSQVGSPSNSVRVLCSSLKNKDEACSEPLSDRTVGVPTGNKRKNASPSKVGNPSSSVRALRSASKAKDETCTEPLNGSAAVEPASNKRKGASPSKAGYPNNNVRVLRSTSKYKNETCSEPLNDSAGAERSTNKRKGANRSKEATPNSSVRVLRSASNNKGEVCSEPLNDSTAGQPAAKRRKNGSSFKVGSPVSSARVLRSTLERKNEASRGCLVLALPSTSATRQASQPQASKIGRLGLLPASGKFAWEQTKHAPSEPLNDSASAQPSAKKRKGGAISETDSPKIGVRVLRSASGKKNEACNEPVNDSTSAQPTVTRRGKPSKDCSPKKDYLKICQRVKYILNRMNYQQTFIQAYASKGWKGQSLEKIRPEKELERAKAEILQSKLKIREAFQNMDSLFSKGKLEESLFNSAGEIASEDIFCAICGSKDVTLQNDIILCDGACDRGFHQNCLNPPLLTEDIPPGDEGWLCPACVCKAASIDALNELQGSKLSIYDSWEKVFPEAASIANGSKQVDASDLLPDHVKDNDNPALAELDMVNEVTFSALDDIKDDLGLPSEDSGDSDFDPTGPDSSEDQKDGLNSEESDFTSDSDDFCAEIAKSCGQDEVSASPLSNVINRTDRMELRAIDNRSNEANYNHAFMEMELEQDMVLPVSRRRQVERLDYKKLYDEAYGRESSNPSDNEEWSGKELLEGSETDSLGERLHPPKWCSRRTPAGQQNNEYTPQRERLHGSESERQTEILCSNGSSSTGRKFGPIVTQKLKVHFEKNPYPSRATKENLAQELGLTFKQVSRWFSSIRHYSRVSSAKKEMHPNSHTNEKNNSTAVDSMQARQPNAGVMETLTRDSNAIVSEKPMVQTNLNQCNIEDIPLSGTEIEMESYGQESSDSSDEEWSALSTPRKARLQDSETASLAESLRSAKRCSRRTPGRAQNNEHTQSEQLHGSASEQQTEVLCSNVSSGKTSNYHFGPIVRQKLKEHFEKDPYPCRATKESLAQELGLTFNQVNKWFSATRHYSRDAVAKNEKYPGENTTENNNSASFDGIQVIEPNVGLIDKPAADINDMISEKMMVQINLNEGIEEDIPSDQYNRCEETMTPAAISREAGSPGYGPRENFLGVSSRNTSCEQSGIMAPTAIAREVCPPGYAQGENQGNGAPWNTSFEQRLFTSPANSSREVGPPGYGPEVNQGSGISLNTSSEQIFFMSPTSISRELGPPGYGPRENQSSGTSWNTIWEQGVFTSPVTTSREAGPPGYGPGENQDNDNTSCKLSMFTSPMTISREVGLPGYELGENKSNGASWNTSYQQGVFMSPTTISRETVPPGFGSGKNQGNGTSWYMSSKQSVFTSPTTISREVGPSGYIQENQGTGASWNTNYEQGVFMSPTDISREVGPPGYGPGENQGNIVTSRISTWKQSMFSSPSTISSEVSPPGYIPGTGGSRNMNLEQRVLSTPATISREIFPPGYGPGENQGGGASSSFISPQAKSAEKVGFLDEARKKAIQRELRRRQKFR